MPTGAFAKAEEKWKGELKKSFDKDAFLKIWEELITVLKNPIDIDLNEYKVYKLREDLIGALAGLEDDTIEADIRHTINEKLKLCKETHLLVIDCLGRFKGDEEVLKKHLTVICGEFNKTFQQIPILGNI